MEFRVSYQESKQEMPFAIERILKLFCVKTSPRNKVQNAKPILHLDNARLNVRRGPSNAALTPPDQVPSPLLRPLTDQGGDMCKGHQESNGHATGN